MGDVGKYGTFGWEKLSFTRKECENRIKVCNFPANTYKNANFEQKS